MESMANVDALVLGTVNASWRRAIDSETLAACLRGDPRAERWMSHVRTFFEDVSREAMLRFMLAHELTAFRTLATYRDCFAPDERDHDGIDGWLAELADAA